MTDQLKVLVICGSLRKGSYNAALARMAPKLAPPGLTFVDAPSFADLPISATCVRVPVLVGHAEAVWVETEEALSPERASELLAASPAVQVEPFPSPGKAAGACSITCASR